MQIKQRGASTLGTVIFLGILGYGVFLGLQYVPQKIENMSIDSILEGLNDLQKQNSFNNVRDVENTIDRLLNTSDLDHLKGNFKVRQNGNDITVDVSREWSLNLIYTVKTMKYANTLTLK